MNPVTGVVLAVLLVAVPVLALLFTGLWVVTLVRKYQLFSDEQDPQEDAAPDGEAAGEDPPPREEPGP